MKLIAKRPWILFWVLFLLPVIAWSLFIYLANTTRVGTGKVDAEGRPVSQTAAPTLNP